MNQAPKPGRTESTSESSFSKFEMDLRRSGMVSVLRRSFGLPRVWSNSELRKIGPLFKGDIINVSAWDDQDKEGAKYRSYFPNATAYFTSNYSGARGTDGAVETDFLIDLTVPLQAELLSRFDVVFNHTTLEHVFDVNMAFGNLCLLSRDIVIVVVPFAQQLHFTAAFGDYWRFSPMAIRMLFQKSGFQVVYEAANSDSNAGIYLFVVGSRYPEQWRSVLPSYEPMIHLGEWIGHIWYSKIAKGLFVMLAKVGVVKVKPPLSNRSRSH